MLRWRLNALALIALAAAFTWSEGIALRFPSLASLRREATRLADDAWGMDPAGASSASDPWPDVSFTSQAVSQGRVGAPADRRKDFRDGDDTSIRNHWALLVAGSAGWSNYRHQADVCHSYQVLLRGGLRPAHIVVMMYDDIAYDPDNPFPGQVFNSPGGPDVYEGVRIDYSGPDVNAATFLAVLEGNSSAVPQGGGSGRVLASGPYDRIFLFYSDHGSPGVLGMPSGSFLYADELVGALQRKYHRRGYKEAVLYVEACESGSMFEGLLPADIAAYVTTASNAFESSWGTYCPGMSPGPSPVFSTCLGDLYSVAWMENADYCDLTHETLMTQYDIVRNRTSHNYTYAMGSHVMQYGTLAITREVAGDYEGMRNRGGGGPDGEPEGGASCRPGPGPAPSAASVASSVSELGSDPASDIGPGSRMSFSGPVDAVGSTLLRGSSGSSTRSGGQGRGGGRDVLEARRLQAVGGAALRQQPHLQRHSLEQRDADLAPLRHREAYGYSPEARREAQSALQRELDRRHGIDSAALAAATSLLVDHPDLAAEVAAVAAAGLTSATFTTAVSINAAATADTPAGGAADNAVFIAMAARELTHGPMGRPASGRPLVDNWDCLRAMVAAWAEACGPMDQYAMRHTRLLANLCNARVAPVLLAGALRRGGAAGGGGGAGEERLLPT